MIYLFILITSLMITTGVSGLVAQTEPSDLVSEGQYISPLSSDAADAPVITVWYGHTQTFGTRDGRLNNPQTWANILGNVSPAGDITSLSYTLNGGPPISLRIGPDDRRLAEPGDFNVQIDYSQLNHGNNTVIITAVDDASASSQLQVTVVRSENGAIWTPGTYTFDWSTITKVTDLAQPIDGKWALVGAGVKSTIMDYDRLLGIGDMSWEDYTVTVPITVYSHEGTYGAPSGGPAIGIITRWNGHSQSNTEEPPYTGWHELGALAWYRWRQPAPGVFTEGLELIGAHNWDLGKSAFPLEFGETYNFKLNIESSANPNQAAYYRFKVWPAAENEPAGWLIEKRGNPAEPDSGSLLLVAHHVDAVFGDVQVELHSTIPGDGDFCDLTVSTVGQGEVIVSPGRQTYLCGADVTLEAIPESGHQFAGWSGDATGTTNPIDVTIGEDTNITATFEAAPEERTLAVTVNGAGDVTVEPLKESYLDGDIVTLTAVPEEHSQFVNWGGDAGGTTNPLTVVMDSDKSIVANFDVDMHTLTVLNPDGGGTVTIDPPGTQFSHGTQVILTAHPAEGFYFSEWAGSVSSSSNPLLLTITEDMVISVNFKPGTITYSLFLPSVLDMGTP